MERQRSQMNAPTTSELQVSGKIVVEVEPRTREVFPLGEQNL
jgi:hypothetical protein